LELRQLRYAEAVARHRHFTRAAEELHVAQSALSNQIKRLEAELGTELFERSSRHVLPTEAGEAVAARARRVLGELDGVREEVDELRGVVRGHIWIGALLPAGELDVPRLVARFSETHPEIEVSLREGTSGETLDYLQASEVDAAFVMLVGPLPGDLEGERLSEDEIVAVFPPGAAPGRGPVTAAHLARYPIVAPRSGSATMHKLRELFARQDEPLRVSLESGDPFLLRCLASGGFGATVIPRSLTLREGPPIDVRSLRPAVRLPVALAWRKSRASPATRAFVDFVRRESSA
jgi:LysR family transcriptional regulator, transcription activator of glutamate synthase operon